ncbi:unnamed protein product [Brachionus calyciflorus]|nr:unnamed protein product [Brachionus calyciflorus]
MKKNEEEQIKFQGNLIERVDKLKYLGVWIDGNITSKTHLNKRIPSFTIAFHQLKKCGIINKNVTTEIKLCFYIRNKTYTRPLLYYGIENQVLNKTQLITLQRLESSFIKAMFLIGKKTRSTILIRACKIETVNELKNKTKVNFANKLLQFETTAMLISELNQVDKFIWLDKKSLFNELEELTGDHLEFGPIVVEGLRMINNTRLMIRENMKNPQIQEVKAPLSLTGKTRKETLHKLLEIKF